MMPRMKGPEMGNVPGRMKAPAYLPSKKPRKRKMPVVDAQDAGRIHLELKTFLQTRRLVVERSLNPDVRAEAKKLDLYIAYLRSLETGA